MFIIKRRQISTTINSKQLDESFSSFRIELVRFFYLLNLVFIRYYFEKNIASIRLFFIFLLFYVNNQLVNV